MAGEGGPSKGCRASSLADRWTRWPGRAALVRVVVRPPWQTGVGLVDTMAGEGGPCKGCRASSLADRWTRWPGRAALVRVVVRPPWQTGVGLVR